MLFFWLQPHRFVPSTKQAEHPRVGKGLAQVHPHELLNSVCGSVGALCDHAYISPKTYVEVWPTQGEAIYGRFHVQLLSEEPGAGFTVWTLALTNRQQVGSLRRDGPVFKAE